MNELLVEMAFGAVRRAVVMLPPQNGKSTLISHYTPAWWAGTFPDDPMILTSYEAEFATTWGWKSKEVVRDTGHLFGLALAKDSASHWTVNDRASGRARNGGLHAVGMGGAITGRAPSCSSSTIRSNRATKRGVPRRASINGTGFSRRP